jgi:triacylglycerol lipase
MFGQRSAHVSIHKAGSSLRRLAVVGLVVGVMLGCVAPTASAAPLEPVILVHGVWGSSKNMTKMKIRFQEHGYLTFAIDLPGQNNVTNANALATYVSDVKSQTGSSKVHLVSHSMGGLSTRHYIKYGGGGENVRTYVSFGTPQYGYQPACVLAPDQGGQMCPSGWFLGILNFGDDTPGSVPYTTIRSSKDTPNITRLDGGACFHEIPGVEHPAEPDSPEFFKAALQAVQGTCPGTFQNLPNT